MKLPIHKSLLIPATGCGLLVLTLYWIARHSGLETIILGYTPVNRSAGRSGTAAAVRYYEDSFLKILAENKTWNGRVMLLSRIPNIHFSLPRPRMLTLMLSLRHNPRRAHDPVEQYIQTGGLNISNLARVPMTQYPQAWERAMLHQAPLMNPLDAGNASTSHLVLIRNRSKYRVFNKLQVLIHVLDGNGHHVTRGGDHVRVWLVDRINQACLATEVEDLNNGTYSAIIPLLWPGKMEVRASLNYNRHVQRAVHFVRNVVKSTKFLAAGFTTVFSSETTLCSPFPHIPGYSGLCDLSKENGGMSWYCGRPRNAALLCRHWSAIADLPFVNPLPLTNAEREWFAWMENVRNSPRIPEGGRNILTVTTSRPKLNVKPPCSKRRWTSSWTEPAPRGYFMREKWIPRSCSLTNLSQARLASCLSDTTVLLLGDSNLRLVFAILAERLGCVINTGTVKPKWHKPLLCVNDSINMKMTWRTHALPFHFGSDRWGDREDPKAVSQYLNEIPRDGRFIIVLHLYLHFTPHHYSAFVGHVRAVRMAAERLLRRNPNVQIVVRGPHGATRGWSTLYGGDLVGPLYTDILRSEFAGLYHKVLLLLPWDMTIAMENTDFHPPGYVNNAIVDLLLSHVCA